MSQDTMNPTTTSSNAAWPTDRKWKTWPDWVNLVLGGYVALAPLWTTGASAGWFVTLGLLLDAGSLWALGSASSPASEWTMIVLAAVLFLAPWMGGFAAATGAAWTAWIVGLAVIVFSAVGLSQRKKSAA
ncbi:SPW repeat domain-containing protein [Propionibacteriaceae bacterium Y1923]